MCFVLPANGRHLPVAVFCIALAMQRGLRQGRPPMHADLPDLLPGLHQALSIGCQALRCRLPPAASGEHSVSGSAAQTPGVCGSRRARVRMRVMFQLEMCS